MELLFVICVDTKKYVSQDDNMTKTFVHLNKVLITILFFILVLCLKVKPRHDKTITLRESLTSLDVCRIGSV